MARPQEALESHILAIANFDIDQRRRFVGLTAADIERVVAVKGAVLDHLDAHIEVFFDFLRQLDAAHGLIADRALLDRAKRLKRDHLMAMVGGTYGRGYVEQRLELGTIYSAAELDIRAFLGAFQALLNSISHEIAKLFAKDAVKALEHIAAVKKIGFLDLSVILDVMVADRERTIFRQQDAIRELSTPILQVRDRLLILPIIGVLESQRARQLTDGLLHAIRANRAKVVVMDITGVATVDTKVANHLIQTVAAARLMGATVIVTGLSAEVAQALVTLGVDLRTLNTMGDLQGGLEEAERALGYEVVQRRAERP